MPARTIQIEGVQTAITPNLPETMVPIMALGSPASGTEIYKFVPHVASLTRAIVPISGKLKDISILNGKVKGEINLGIFDTGDAAAGHYTLLAESGLKPQAGEGEWQSFGTLGELELAAGQQIMVGLVASVPGAECVGIFRGTAATFRALVLPTGYLPTLGGASPKLVAQHEFALNKFASLTEAEMEAGAETGASWIARLS